MTTEGKLENLNLANAITWLLQGTRMHLGRAKIGGLCMKMILKGNLKLLAWKKYQQTGPSITCTLMACNLYLTFNYKVVENKAEECFSLFIIKSFNLRTQYIHSTYDGFRVDSCKNEET